MLNTNEAKTRFQNEQQLNQTKRFHQETNMGFQNFNSDLYLPQIQISESLNKR